MQIPLAEVIDRYTIIRLKSERLSPDQKVAEPFLQRELAAYSAAIGEFKAKGITVKQEWIDELYAINGKCWDKEADIRQGKENMLGLEEVGKRTILLREYNKERNAAKNRITFESGTGFPEIKIDHGAVDMDLMNELQKKEKGELLVKNLRDLRIKIFADGADKASILELVKKPYIKGITTNPTLMKKAGIKNYEEFAKDILKEITNIPISFEVFSDEFSEMERQARKIASWGKNVYVKIPVTNSKGESSFDVVKNLSSEKINLNLTAIYNVEQTAKIIPAVAPGASAFISLFVGRIADSGRDPMPIVKKVKELLRPRKELELLWASVREPWHIWKAEEIGCEIITVPPDALAKLGKFGTDLDTFSLETVKAFAEDARSAGYEL